MLVVVASNTGHRHGDVGNEFNFHDLVSISPILVVTQICW